MSHDQSTLILIPSYNAARTLGELISRLQASTPLPILVIDDGSTDETSAIALSSGVMCITVPTNQGKGAALKIGFEYAIRMGYCAVITIDADLQHLPEEIPRFVARNDGHTILIGTRQITLSAVPFGRWVSNNWTSIIVSVFSTRRVRDSQSGFRLIPADVLKSVTLWSTRYDMESELLFKAGALGYAVGEVPVSTVYGDEKSAIAPIRDAARFMRQTWKRIWL